MEFIKAHLPEIVQSRVEDLINVQTTDEEMSAHVQELEARIASLEALAREEGAEEARRLVEELSGCAIAFAGIISPSPTGRA